MAHVLIIEDEKDIAMILKEVLSIKGFDISIANDGFTGLKMLNETDDIDLAVVDINMPGMGGRQIIEFMRSKDNLREIPAVIITGNAYNTDNLPPIGTYDAIFEKPFDVFGFAEKLVEIISYKKKN